MEHLISVFASRNNGGNTRNRRDRRVTHANLISTLAATAGAVAIGLWVIKRSVERNQSGVLDELEREIALDQSQRSQIEGILAVARRRYMQTGQHNEAQLIESRNSTRCQIGALLTLAQRPLFEQWIRKRDAIRNSGGGRSAAMLGHSRPKHEQAEESS